MNQIINTIQEVLKEMRIGFEKGNTQNGILKVELEKTNYERNGSERGRINKRENLSGKF